VYGVPREEVGVAEAEQTTNPWRFPGQYEDVETGLYYNRFRYYDPQIGRYISEDPIGLLGGVGLYVYVCDPITWWDPLGLAGACGPRRTKHVDNRHLDRKKYPDKSKFRKPSQVDKLIERVLASPDQVIGQGARVRMEKQFGREVGTDGESVVVVVLDSAKNKVVTAFPAAGLSP
jgi:RHS repeat-associated protein